MSLKYCILAAEGPHDQAAIGRLLKLFGLEDFASKFGGDPTFLDAFWVGFIPKTPPKKLYVRSSMPSIFTSQTHSVAVYQGEGSNLIRNLLATIGTYVNKENNRKPYIEDIHAIGLIVDADTSNPSDLARKYADELLLTFPMISGVPGTITVGTPRTGIYVLPDNKRQGTLDSILVDCAANVYSDHKVGAEAFLNGLDDKHKKHWRKPFGGQKALVASIVSVLEPGMANTSSIAQDNWIGEETVKSVAEIASLKDFLAILLELV